MAGAFCLLVSTSICPAQTRGLTTVVAAPGDRSPNGRIASPENFALADVGSVFSADLQSSGLLAVFTRISKAETEVVQVGTVLTDAGTVTGINDALSINLSGQALVSATTIDSSSVTHNALLTGTSPTTLRTVAFSGQTVPDGNGQYDVFTGQSINKRSGIGFWASIKNSLGSIAPVNAVFIGHGDGTVTQVARTGQPAPGETNVFYSMGAPAAINSLGQFSFAAEISDSHFGTGNNYGLYRNRAGGSLIKLARSYDVAPNTPYLFGFLQAGGLNDGGMTCFYSSLITSSGVFKGYGLFKSGNGTDTVPVAYVGQSAPGGLGLYTTFDSVIDINSSGQVAYTGYYATSTSSGSGVFLGDGITQSALAVTGQAAPDGSIFTGFGSCRVNDNGAVLFVAQTDYAPGFNAIYVMSGSTLAKVVRIGDVVAGAQVTQMGYDPGAFNNLNQVSYEATDPSGNRRILLFTPRF